MTASKSVRRLVLIAGTVASAAGCGGGKPTPTTAAPAIVDPQSDRPPAAPVSRSAALLRKLRSPSPTAQGAAVDELAAAAATDPEIVPGLVAAVDDKANRGAGAVFPNQVNSVREGAVAALLKSGPAGERAFAEQALPKLIVGLGDPDPAVREHTAVALARSGRRAGPSVPALWSLAEDESVNVRGAAYRALVAAEPSSTLPAAALLAHPDPAVRGHAAEMLRRFQPLPDAAVPLLADALGGDDPFVRGAAAMALIPFGPKAGPAVPALVDVVRTIRLADLQKPEPIELAPVNALAAVGEPAVGPTAKLLKDKEPLVRYLAAYTLGEIGPPAEPALPELTKLLRDTSGQVALEAARAVAVIGDDSEPTTELMKFALEHQEPATRLYALQTIVRMGKSGRGLAPLALPLIDDPTPDVRRAALTYVGTLDPATAKPVVGKVADMLKADDESTRLEAARVLGDLGPAAGQAAEALGRTAANDSAPPVRTAALDALADLGKAGKGAVPGLITLAGNSDADEADRARAVAVLPRLGPDDGPAVGAVLAASTDRSAVVREVAATAIGHFTNPSDEAVKRLGDMAETDASVATRSAALESIARLGPACRGRQGAGRGTGRPSVRSLEALGKSRPGPDRRTAGRCNRGRPCRVGLVVPGRTTGRGRGLALVRRADRRRRGRRDTPPGRRLTVPAADRRRRSRPARPGRPAGGPPTPRTDGRRPGRRRTDGRREGARVHR